MRKLTLYFLIGLPASGKSTLANKMMKENKNLVRLNKDLLNEMLHGKNWAPKKQKLTILTERALAHQLLLREFDVIVDNTHLNAGHQQEYMNIAKNNNANFEIIKLDTLVEECIRRDEGRRTRGERYVGRDVILNMAHQYGYLKQERPIAIFDLDGTLADCAHRRHWVRNTEDNLPNFKPNWVKFFEEVSKDVVRPEVVAKLNDHYNQGNEIVICSGRSEVTRQDTEQWLLTNGIHYDRLIMRSKHDSRDDTIVKQEFIDKYLDKSKIIEWYDDRPKVIRQVRSNGINVIDVGDGIEF